MDAVTSSGATALHFAAAKGHEEVIRTARGGTFSDVLLFWGGGFSFFFLGGEGTKN